MDSSNAHGTRLTFAIDKDTLQELCCTPVDKGQIDERGTLWFVEHNELIDKTRWTLVYQLVIRPEDSTDTYGFTYETAAGESNVDFWGEYDSIITLNQVFPKTVTVTTYE